MESLPSFHLAIRALKLEHPKLEGSSQGSWKVVGRGAVVARLPSWRSASGPIPPSSRCKAMQE
jgi:hypothetical protein